MHYFRTRTSCSLEAERPPASLLRAPPFGGGVQQRTDWLLHLPTCMLFGLSKPRTRFLHPFWTILGHLRVPRCLSGPIQGKLTHGGSPGGCLCCFLSVVRPLVPSWGGAIPIFMKIRLVERHQTPEYNARYLPPNSFLAVTFLNQA